MQKVSAYYTLDHTVALRPGWMAPDSVGLCRASLTNSAATHRPIRISFGARCRRRSGIEIRRQNPGELYRLSNRRVSDPPNGRVGPEEQPAQSMPNSTSTVSTPSLVGAGRVTHDTRRPAIRTKEGHHPRAAALRQGRVKRKGGMCLDALNGLLRTGGMRT